MTKNKINWISILQGWAMFLVILGHCAIWTEYEWCKDVCYGVHMPLFMFISGGLFYITRIKKEWKWNDVVVDKLKRLGIPYVFFIALGFCLKAAFASRVKHGVDLSWTSFFEGFVYPINSGMKEMWFVAALLLIMFAFPLYRLCLRNKIASVTLLAVAAVLPYIFTSYTGGGIFNWMGALRYFVFFYAGILFFKYDGVNYLKMNTEGGVILTLIYLAICSWHNEQTVAIAFVGIIGFVWLSKQLSQRCPNFLKSFRDYSFQIFLLGIYPQMFVELFLMKKFTALWMQPFLLVVSVTMGIYIPVLVSKLVQRIGNKYVNIVLGLK